MALQFSTPIQTAQGFTVDAAYVRLTTIDLANGTQVSVPTEYYISKEAFEAGSAPFLVDSFNVNADFKGTFDYNRNVDGVDTLQFAHNKMVEQYAAAGITATIVGL